MAFGFNQPQQPQQQAPQQGIASLPAQSSAQGGFAFQPQAALQHPSTLPTAQPLTNQQLGINPQANQANQASQFAQSMAAWEAARQAELAGIKPMTTVGATQNNRQPYSMADVGFGYSRVQPQVIGSGSGMGGLPFFNRFQNKAATPAPAPAPFNIAPLPTDPQQYTAYVAQQQAAFEAAKRARGG